MNAWTKIPFSNTIARFMKFLDDEVLLNVSKSYNCVVVVVVVSLFIHNTSTFSNRRKFIHPFEVPLSLVIQ